MAEQTVTVRQAAEMTGLSVKALQRRVERGELPAVVESGRRRIAVSALYRAGLLAAEPAPEGSGVDVALERVGRLSAAMAEAVAQLRAEIGAERADRPGDEPG